ncbi:DUF896 domain-containing protein [Eubacterium sp.]|uniref:DUF896 domain-containing protein n=1 Tax=Eubacterium sp. TaxID=142586 RepID=UPI0015C18B4C|nr:DUF896 domain-containing protein [uncultured Eubacterium sp.]
MTEEKIKRINELAHKSKTPEGLTEEEKQEQAILRQEYINSFKASLIGQLENTYIVRPDGSKERLERKNKKWEN